MAGRGRCGNGGVFRIGTYAKAADPIGRKMVRPTRLSGTLHSGRSICKVARELWRVRYF